MSIGEDTIVAVGLRELKARLSEYVSRARAGETIIVTDRNKPIAQLVPLGPPNPVIDALRGLVDQGVVEWSGGKPVGFPPGEGPKLRGGPSVSDVVIQERNER
jgi:prevent-host-death family protein